MLRSGVPRGKKGGKEGVEGRREREERVSEGERGNERKTQGGMRVRVWGGEA